MTAADGQDEGALTAARIARGPSPADLVARHAQTAAAPPDIPDADAPAIHDPLRLCIYATIAALGWLLGPLTLTIFAAVAFAGYWTAWRAGLTRSRCWLRDTRLVLLYLGMLAAAGIAGIVLFIIGLVT